MDADQNLLFGMLALQNGFVDRHLLLAALEHWSSDPTQRLDALLASSGSLDADQCRVLWALVEQHVRLNERHVEHSNAAARHDHAWHSAALDGSATGKPGPVVKHVEAAGRPIQPPRATAATMKGAQNVADEYKTQPAAAGNTTSSGRRFDILRPLAKGGIGQVWVAQDMELRREVAFKELQEQYADNDEFRDDFVLEAEITGGLEHPCIVPIYGLGQHPDGRPFYAMRFVRGESLHEALEQFHAESTMRTDPGKRSLKLHKILARFVHACNAVEYAHSRGVIHRDLKPLNIMLGKFGETFVVDWGEAKALDRLSQPSNNDEPRLQTSCNRDTDRMGKPVGTPAYMSPEQAEGRHDLLGPASDVYSLGATLYHILTGRAPIGESDSGAALQKAIKSDVRPAREVNKSVPTALAAICQKAMAVKPTDRYRSARALADDVEHWLADERVSAHVEAWPHRAFRVMRHHKSTTAAFAAALAMLVFGGGFAVELARRENDRTRAYDLAEALLTANPAAVGHLLDALHPYGALAAASVRECQQHEAQKVLRGGGQAADAEAAKAVAEMHRLRVAYALADLGEADLQIGFLLERLPNLPADECRNLIAALQKDAPAAVKQLVPQASKADDVKSRVRYAIVALHLGDAGPARRCLRIGADPTLRTTFIHDFAEWHGDLRDIVALLRRERDRDVLSGLCAAIGRVPSDSLPREERLAALEVLKKLSHQAADGATHSASRWALKRWKQPAQPIPGGNAAENPGKRWYVNSQQMTMIELSPDGNQSGPAIGALRPFYLASREVTIEQFARFVEDDKSFASEHAADSWASVSHRETPACPVNNVNWLHAILFCNWLSAQEGLPTAYTNRGGAAAREGHSGEAAFDAWQCDLNSAGYRLPTKAEWQWACRAGSAERFDFHFGDEESLLSEYGWYLNNAAFRVQPVGTKLPNAFGIFDMHGNVEEWCWDTFDSGAAQSLIDRAGQKRMHLLKPAAADGRTVCGGNCNNPAADCAWDQIRGVPSSGQAEWPAIGFRVARSKTSTEQ